MVSAPFRYRPDGSVDWGNMWDTFCVLARDGGPPHRASLLEAPLTADLQSPTFQRAAAEIIRGVEAVSDLAAFVAEPGWIGIRCDSPKMAQWLAESIVLENVQARHQDALLLVPVGEDFTVKYEIKNVITAVAKTTHYWREHLRRAPGYFQRVHPETVVLDIGGDTGALIIYAQPNLRGQQIDVSRKGSDAKPIHTDVLERRLNGRAVFAAVFPALERGDYQILVPEPTLPDAVTIRGGDVAEVDWR
jgi:sirohydrochlorin cobaltochelatase